VSAGKVATSDCCLWPRAVKAWPWPDFHSINSNGPPRHFSSARNSLFLDRCPCISMGIVSTPHNNESSEMPIEGQGFRGKALEFSGRKALRDSLRTERHKDNSKNFPALTIRATKPPPRNQAQSTASRQPLSAISRLSGLIVR